MIGAAIKTLIPILPDGVFCRELKLLYKSGRLVDGFMFKDYEMGLNTIEKMFVRWALKQWKKQVLRGEMKAWATKLAITGKDDHGIPTTHNDLRRSIYQGTSLASIRANTTAMGQSVQDARGEEDRRAILQAVRSNRESGEVGKDVGNA